jgi:hypothetical protein
MQIPEEIVTIAKDAMLRFGNVPPPLFVHGTKGKLYLRLDWGRDNAERTVSQLRKASMLS